MEAVNIIMIQVLSKLKGEVLYSQTHEVVYKTKNLVPTLEG
jgi:hypothetical protein